MTASQKAKAAGLPSLAEVVRISGVAQQTLDRWSKHKPQLFAVVLEGCAAIRARELDKARERK